MTDSRFLALALVFAPLSILSFGGGQAIVPEIQHQTVTVHAWLTDTQFADLFAISRAAPGPSTPLIVALIGWQVAGFFGALAAIVCILLPSSLTVYLASAWWLRNKQSTLRKAIERGLAPVGAGLVFAAAMTVFRSAGGGVLALVTAGAVCAILSLTKINTYGIVSLVVGSYLALYALFPVVAG